MRDDASDDGDDGDDALDVSDIIVVDAGACQWKAGRAGEEGASATPEGSERHDEQQWRDLFEELDIEPEHAAVLLSERPGTSSSDRARTSSMLLQKLSIRALYLAPPPLMTSYGTDMLTGVIVDVGERSTTLWALFDGFPIGGGGFVVVPLGAGHLTDFLDAKLRALGHSPASAHDGTRAAREAKESLASVALDGKRRKTAKTSTITLAQGGTLSIGADVCATCAEGLFDPGVLGIALPAGVVGLHTAVLRTVALADVSLRSALLGNVVLAGGGSLLTGLAERLERELKHAIGTRVTWRPKVVATGARRYSAWLGGGVMANLSECRAAFVHRELYAQQGASVLDERFPALAGRTIDEACGEEEARKEADAAMRRTELTALASRARAMAADARAWWIGEAPADGTVERARMRHIQELVCLPLQRSVLDLLLMPSTQSSPFTRAAALAAAANLLRLSHGSSSPAAAAAAADADADADDDDADAADDADADADEMIADHQRLRGQLQQATRAAWAADVRLTSVEVTKSATNCERRAARCRARGFAQWHTCAQISKALAERATSELRVRMRRWLGEGFVAWAVARGMAAETQSRWEDAYDCRLGHALRRWRRRGERSARLTELGRTARQMQCSAWVRVRLATWVQLWRGRARGREAWAAGVARACTQACGRAWSHWTSQLVSRAKAARMGDVARGWCRAHELKVVLATWGARFRRRRTNPATVQSGGGALLSRRRLRVAMGAWHQRASTAAQASRDLWRLQAHATRAAALRGRWVGWRGWVAVGPERKAARALLLSAVRFFGLQRCWHTMLGFALSCRWEALRHAQACVRSAASAYRRCWRVWAGARAASEASLLAVIFGARMPRRAAPGGGGLSSAWQGGSALSEWIVASSTERSAIGRLLRVAVRLAHQRAWRSLRIGTATRRAARRRSHSADCLATERRARALATAVHHWDFCLRSRALRSAGARHRATTFREAMQMPTGWRRWRTALGRHALLMHEVGRLGGVSAHAARTRVKVDLAQGFFRWATVARMLSAVRTEASRQHQEEEATQNLRVLLAGGRRWAERLLVEAVP